MGSNYICKFCNRNFPCGRSLGGHIRSHLIHTNNNSTIISPSNDQPKSSKTGYELRENPKKTNKGVKLLSSSSSSWSNESESDPISIHKAKKNGKGSSSFVVGNNNSHSSVSEVVEGEEDEVAIAMCLIMLSRDVGKWGNVTSCESNDDILLLQPKETKKFTIKTEKKQGKCSVFDANGVDDTYKKGKYMGVSCFGSLENGSKMKNNDQSKSEEVENVSTWNLQCGLKLKENEALPNGLMLNTQCNKPPLNKRKIDDDGNDNSNKKRYEIATNGGFKNWSKMMEFEVCEDEFVLNDKMSNTNKRSKFECATCNKVFHSYQALGGHRASHKRVLLDKNSHVLSQKTGYPPPTAVTDSLISNLDEFANGEYDLSTPPTPSNNQQQQQQRRQSMNDIKIGSSSSSLSIKKGVQKHECPFCFRVFPSGQALGGHKRSHMLGNNNNNLVEINMIGRSSSKTRDLLDLNLPPTHIEEDTTTITTTSSSKSHAELIKPYWWVEHPKHEPSLSLISN